MSDWIGLGLTFFSLNQIWKIALRALPVEPKKEKFSLQLFLWLDLMNLVAV